MSLKVSYILYVLMGFDMFNMLFEYVQYTVYSIQYTYIYICIAQYTVYV